MACLRHVCSQANSRRGQEKGAISPRNAPTHTSNQIPTFMACRKCSVLRVCCPWQSVRRKRRCQYVFFSPLPVIRFDSIRSFLVCFQIFLAQVLRELPVHGAAGHSRHDGSPDVFRAAHDQRRPLLGRRSPVQQSLCGGLPRSQGRCFKRKGRNSRASISRVVQYPTREYMSFRCCGLQLQQYVCSAVLHENSCARDATTIPVSSLQRFLLLVSHFWV